MARVKEEQPPSRPPAPKLSLERLKGKQHSTGSIAIRFSTTSSTDDNEDEEELFSLDKSYVSNRTSLPGSHNGAADRVAEAGRVSPTFSPNNSMDGISVGRGVVDRGYKSAPVSEVTTPVSLPPTPMSRGSPSHSSSGSIVRRGSGKLGALLLGNGKAEDGAERSFISGLREKFHDPLTAFIEKIEESNLPLVSEAIERKLRKAECAAADSPGVGAGGPGGGAAGAGAARGNGAFRPPKSGPTTRNKPGISSSSSLGHVSAMGGGNASSSTAAAAATAAATRTSPSIRSPTTSPTSRVGDAGVSQKTTNNDIRASTPETDNGTTSRKSAGDGNEDMFKRAEILRRTRHSSLGHEQDGRSGGEGDWVDGVDSASAAEPYRDHSPNSEPTGSRSATPETFEIVEDFYGESAEDIFENAGANTTVPNSSSWDPTLKPKTQQPVADSNVDSPMKIKSSLQKITKNLKLKSKSPPPNQQQSSSGQNRSAMTLSNLLSHSSEYGDEQSPRDSELNTSHTTPEHNEFFDAQDTISDSKEDDSLILQGAFHEQDDDKLLEKRKPTPGEQSERTRLSRHKIAMIIMPVVAYVIIPLPPYLSGVVVGMLIGVLVLLGYQWWTASPNLKQSFVLQPLHTIPPLQVPNMIESRNRDGKFKGWMNELNTYTPDDFHINQTHSIFIQLEGTHLRLQTPKHNIPKRAMWDDPRDYMASFIHQRHYDLSQGAIVFLLPEGLCSKRLWSKKYPICLQIPCEKTRTSSSGSPNTPALHSLSPLIPGASSKTDGDISYQFDQKDDELNAEEASESPFTNDGSSVDMPQVEDFRQTSKQITVYLFGRTSREKEEWFRRFKAASQGKPLHTRISDLLFSPEPKSFTMPTSPSFNLPHSSSHNRTMSASSSLDSFKHRRESSTDSNVSDMGNGDYCFVNSNMHDMMKDHLQYLAKVMPAESQDRLWQAISTGEESNTKPPLPPPLLCESQLAWFNAMTARCFWDFLREQYWAEKIKEKIQKKLSKIHVPYFIDALSVTHIELGSEVPIVRKASKPYLDDRGMWVDLDIAYNGGFRMSMETKINLMKLKKPKLPANTHLNFKSTAVTDEEEEDSAESSTDDEGDENTIETNEDKIVPAETKGKKFLRIVDKITKSKYFQQATEYKYIKRAMEGVSNTRLILNVEMRSLVGTLSINIPPPPTDRLWYGFRTNPRLWLSAKPKVGGREVNVSHITDWIEKKLTIEFQRVFVFPNMDDVPIPLMCDQLKADTSKPHSVNTQPE